MCLRALHDGCKVFRGSEPTVENAERKKSSFCFLKNEPNILVDSTDLIIAATVVQTVVITLTLLVFIFQFRGQEKAIKESSYQNLMGRYNDFIMTQVGKPELNKLFIDQIRLFNKQEISPEEALVYGHLLIAYGIIEEAFLLSKKKWIDKATWEQWAAWLKVLSKHPQFIQMHGVTSGMFDKEYEDYVSRIMKER
jgi:hypothetical protein